MDSDDRPAPPGGPPQRVLDLEATAARLEMELDAAAARAPALPWRPTRHLASVYRALQRAADEVSVLERYRDSQSDDALRARCEWRLAKARLIAEQQRASMPTAKP